MGYESTNAALSSVADACVDSFLRLVFADSSCANCKVMYKQFLNDIRNQAQFLMSFIINRRLV